MIKEFNRKNLQTINAELDVLISKYAKDNGIELSISKIKFTGVEFHATLNGKIKNALTREDARLSLEMRVQGLNKVSVCGKKTLVGFNPKSYKYPFIFEENGQKYKIGREAAAIYFKG